MPTNLEDIEAEEALANDQKLNSSIIQLAEQYASCDKRSAAINDERKGIRENAEKLGIPSRAFQHAVGLVKQMSEGEQTDYRRGVNRVLTALQGRQAELFPEAAERIKKRVDAEALAKEEAERRDGTWSSENPRSDPNRGGAKPKTEAAAGAEPKKRGRPSNAEKAARAAGKPPAEGGQPVTPTAAVKAAAAASDAALKEAIAAQEQKDGAALLAGKPKSQSAIAAERHQAAFGRPKELAH